MEDYENKEKENEYIEEETFCQNINEKLEEAIEETRRLGEMVTNLDTEEVTDELLKKAKKVGEEMVQLLIRDLDPLTDIEGQQREKKKDIIKALNLAMDLNDLYIKDFETQLQNEKTNKNQGDESSLSDQHDVKFFRKTTRVQKKETLQATVDGWKFYCYRTDKVTGKKSFRCAFYNTQGCTASFKASKCDSSFTEHHFTKDSFSHSHEKNTEEDIMEIAKMELKKHVKGAPFDQRLKDLYYQFVLEYEKTLSGGSRQTFLDHFPVYNKMKKTLYRWRGEVLPLTPHFQVDLDIENPVFYNDDGEHLVIGDDTDEHGKRVITFGTPSEFHRFAETTRLNIDCTYKSAPTPDWASVLIFQVGNTISCFILTCEKGIL